MKQLTGARRHQRRWPSPWGEADHGVCRAPPGPCPAGQFAGRRRSAVVPALSWPPPLRVADMVTVCHAVRGTTASLADLATKVDVDARPARVFDENPSSPPRQGLTTDRSVGVVSTRPPGHGLPMSPNSPPPMERRQPRQVVIGRRASAFTVTPPWRARPSTRFPGRLLKKAATDLVATTRQREDYRPAGCLDRVRC